MTTAKYKNYRPRTFEAKWSGESVWICVSSGNRKVAQFTLNPRQVESLLDMLELHIDRPDPGNFLSQEQDGAVFLSEGRGEDFAISSKSPPIEITLPVKTEAIRLANALSDVLSQHQIAATPSPEGVSDER